MKILLHISLVALTIAVSSSQITPAVPEPGIVLYGKILSVNEVTTVPATAVMLRIKKQGQSVTSTVQADVVTDPTGAHFYVARIPFETVLPGLQGDPSVLDFDQTQTTDDTFALDAPVFPPNPNQVTHEGTAMTAIGVDSSDSASTFAFGANTARGAVHRMDILTAFDISALPSYDSWTASYPGLPAGERDRTKDFDGDGLTHEFEWLAGLDPTNADPDSPFNEFIVVTHEVAGNPNQRDVCFRPKVAGRIYKVKRSLDLDPNAPFMELPGNDSPSDTPIPGHPSGADSIVRDASLPGAGERGFYVVEIVPEP